MAENKISRIQVLQEILCDATTVEHETVAKDNEDALDERIQRGLNAIIKQGEIINADVFLSSGEKLLKHLYELSTHQVESPYTQGSVVLANSLISGSTVLKQETRLWLAMIKRRLCGKRKIRKPFYCEISRDLPNEVFLVLRKVIMAMTGFAPPFCCYKNNTKTQVVSFSSVRLVKELFVFLSALPDKGVFQQYMKRTLNTGARKGHKVSLIVSEEKKFELTYKHSQGKLVISFHFGEWNTNGFPQH